MTMKTKRTHRTCTHLRIWLLPCVWKATPAPWRSVGPASSRGGSGGGSRRCHRAGAAHLCPLALHLIPPWRLLGTHPLIIIWTAWHPGLLVLTSPKTRGEEPQIRSGAGSSIQMLILHVLAELHRCSFADIALKKQLLQILLRVRMKQTINPNWWQLLEVAAPALLKLSVFISSVCVCVCVCVCVWCRSAGVLSHTRQQRSRTEQSSLSLSLALWFLLFLPPWLRRQTNHRVVVDQQMHSGAVMMPLNCPTPSPSPPLYLLPSSSLRSPSCETLAVLSSHPLDSN